MKLKKAKQLINKYCDVLKVPLSERPAFEHLDEKSDRVEIDYIDGEYWYVSNDKVDRFNNSSTTDVEELLYWIFSDITFTLAEKMCSEKKYDVESTYSLEVADKQLELMQKLDKKMYKLLKEHHTRLAQMLE